MLCTQIRFGFAACLVGRSGESVGRSVGWRFDADVRSGLLKVAEVVRKKVEVC